MRTLTLLIVSLLFLFPVSTNAGKNAGGALIVHTQNLSQLPSYCWDFTFEPCEDTEECFPELESCDVAATDAVGDQFFGSIIWFYAAFPENADPSVTVVYFGVEHNLAPGFLAGWGYCGPPGSLEIPDTGWPEDPNAGNSLAFGEPVTGESLIRAYWFIAYGDTGQFLGSAVNPTGGYAAFVSDDNPGVLDEIDRFGQVLWNEPGYNECPEPLVPGACCFADGACELLNENECGDAGGHEWQGEGTVCDPNPCEPVAIEESSLGTIKARYR